MLTATQARARSRNDVLVYDETKTLELFILHSAQDGHMTCTVTSSDMTGGPRAPAYYAEWKGSFPDPVLRDQIDQVLAHFTRLGYAIDRKTNPNTMNTFQWVISW